MDRLENRVKRERVCEICPSKKRFIARFKISKEKDRFPFVGLWKKGILVRGGIIRYHVEQKMGDFQKGKRMIL